MTERLLISGDRKEKLMYIHGSKQTSYYEGKFSACISKIDRINNYWNLFYQEVEEFHEYIDILAERKYYVINNIEEIINNIVDKCYNVLKEKVNVEKWVNYKKKTKRSFFLNLEDSYELLRFITFIIIVFPLINNIEIPSFINEMINNYQNIIEKIWKLSSYRIKFDSFEEGMKFYSSITTSQAAFLLDFVFAITVLVALCDLFNTENFYSYFISVISEKYKFVIDSSIIGKNVISKAKELFLKRETSANLLNNILIEFLNNKIIKFVYQQAPKIDYYFPTAITNLINEITTDCLKSNIVKNYQLIYQYLFFWIARKVPRLRDLIGRGLALLKCASEKPGQKRKNYHLTDTLLIEILKSADVNFKNVIIDKVCNTNLASIKEESLIALDTGTPYKVSQVTMDNCLKDLIIFYIYYLKNKEEIYHLFHEGLNLLNLQIKSPEEITELLEDI